MTFVTSGMTNVMDIKRKKGRGKSCDRSYVMRGQSGYVVTANPPVRLNSHVF